MADKTAPNSEEVTAENEAELFISYGREPDVVAFVGKLKHDLEGNGFTVWLDQQDILSGSDWHGAIGTGLSKCRGIIPVITRKYLESRFCINELYTADGDKKLIFPIILEDVDFNSSDTAMGVKFVISSINWTWMRPEDSYLNSLHRFMEGLKAKGIGSPQTKGADESSGSHNSPPAPLVGPENTSKPVFRIPDVEMIQGITTGPDGEIIYSSGAKHQIIVCNADGEKICTFGSCGIQPEELMSPSGVAVNSDGHLLVACQFSIKKFTLKGELIHEYGGAMAPDSDESKLQAPSALLIAPNGNVYISELQTHKVKIFDSDLNFISSFTNACPDLGSGHLNMPQGLAVNSEGNVYVADQMNGVVQVFSGDGEFLFKFGKAGGAVGNTTTPCSIAIDSQDYVYLGSGMCTVSIFKKNGDFVRAFGGNGAELGKFNYPRGLHVDKQGAVYVGEWTTNRIQVFK